MNKSSVLLSSKSSHKCDLIGIFLEQEDQDFVVSLLSGPEVECTCLSWPMFKFGSVLQISILGEGTVRRALCVASETITKYSASSADNAAPTTPPRQRHKTASTHPDWELPRAPFLTFHMSTLRYSHFVLGSFLLATTCPPSRLLSPPVSSFLAQ
jgi:hypothetical protein